MPMLEGLIEGLDSIKRRAAHNVTRVLDEHAYNNSCTLPKNGFSLGQRFKLGLDGLVFRTIDGFIGFVGGNKPEEKYGNPVQWGYETVIKDYKDWRHGDFYTLKTAVSLTGIPLSTETVIEGFSHYLRKLSSELAKECQSQTPYANGVTKKSAIGHLQKFYDAAMVGGFSITREFADQMYGHLIKSLDVDSVNLFLEFSKIPLSKIREREMAKAKRIRQERDEQPRRNPYSRMVDLLMIEHSNTPPFPRSNYQGTSSHTRH